jgi:hypothetical protein
VASLAGVLIVPIQPFSVAIADLAIGGLALGKWGADRRINLRDFIPIAGYLVFQLPLLILTWFAFQGDPLWQTFTSQYVLLSPPLIYYLLGMGLLLPFAIWGAYLAWKRKNILGLMCVCWLIGALLLSYAPTLLQRRFSFGLTIPVGFLAAGGIGSGLIPLLANRFGMSVRRRFGLISTLIVSAAMVSTIYLSLGSATYVRSQPEDLFDPQSMLEAIQRMDSFAEPDQVVLSSYRTGMILPGLSRLRSYIGHPIETLDFPEKEGQVESFFSGKQPGETSQLNLPVGCGCDWLFIGPYEDKSNLYWYETNPRLQLKYAENEIHIYRISEGNSPEN